MKINDTRNPASILIATIPYGRSFISGEHHFMRTNTGIHLTDFYFYGTDLESGLLTRFGPEQLVIPLEAEVTIR